MLVASLSLLCQKLCQHNCAHPYLQGGSRLLCQQRGELVEDPSGESGLQPHWDGVARTERVHPEGGKAQNQAGVSGRHQVVLDNSFSGEVPEIYQAPSQGSTAGDWVEWRCHWLLKHPFSSCYRLFSSSALLFCFVLFCFFFFLNRLFSKPPNLQKISLTYLLTPSE